MAINKRVTGRTTSTRPVETGVLESKASGFNGDLIDGLVTKVAGSEVHSNQLRDPFLDFYSGGYGAPIQPIYDFARLAQIPLQNNALSGCIEAYRVNIESYGHVLEYVGAEGQEHLPRVQAERRKLDSFLSFPSPDGTDLRTIRERSRVDKETIGNRFFEISRDRAGRIVMFDQIPSTTMRITRRDIEPTEVIVDVPDPDEPGQFIEKTIYRTFRRFVQLSPRFEKIYFKEFGDPRPIDPASGAVNETLAVEDQATEVYWDYIYYPGYAYGFPRWIGNLPSILGTRESEMVNLNFFRENAIPAMAVLVSGGALTEESYEKIKAYINSVRGAASMNRIMVIEAATDDSAGDIDHSQPAPKIALQPMMENRNTDGQFQEYAKNGTNNTMASMRLPPIFAGRASDYTRASAYASVITAENQVFAPERTSFDDIMNTKILVTWKPKYFRFKSLAAPMNDADSIAKLVKTFGDQGALTPNIAIKLANKVLDVKIDPVTDEWGNYPFEAILAIITAGGEVPGISEVVGTATSALAQQQFEHEKANPDTPADANGNASSKKPGGQGKPAAGRGTKPKATPGGKPATGTPVHKNEAILSVTKRDLRQAVNAEVSRAFELLDDALYDQVRLHTSASE